MPSTPNFLDRLEEKNFFSQVSNKSRLHKYLIDRKIFLYCGFDPTNNSLHVGHLLPILCLKYFQSFGHTPILLIGGATGMIGDPSFKRYERKKNSLDLLRYNQTCLEKQLLLFFHQDDRITNKAIILNNYTWLKDFSVLSFLKKVGDYFSVNHMIHRESVKKRLTKEKTGMSFSEFSYSLLQAYDFSVVYKHYGVKLQIGGSDQWGNILSGIRLIRKLYHDEVFGLTCPLLTKSNGEKFGKTESNTIWLDPKKTSPYKFYQFWMNIPDSDVNNFFSLFSLFSTQETNMRLLNNNYIEEIINKKIFLANFLTQFVHGSNLLTAVQRIVNILFGKGSIQDIQKSDFLQLLQDGVPLIKCGEKISLSHALVKSLLSPSLTKARNMIVSGSIKINGIVQNQRDYVFIKSDVLFEKYTLLCRGKKNYVLIHWDL
ncbi:tyrosine--tRNA ligase [Buchnera aphidicola]|uniref:tyrosine--tRNA ligase n=1 Tax=Buchnera aphidicola TaxID=9 RepID=UPI00094CB854|nr:tyrosine--tRNA ligase [Buchnera aphidicola]